MDPARPNRRVSLVTFSRRCACCWTRSAELTQVLRIQLRNRRGTIAFTGATRRHLRRRPPRRRKGFSERYEVSVRLRWVYRRQSPVTLFRGSTFGVARGTEYAQEIGVQFRHRRRRLLLGVPPRRRLWREPRRRVACSGRNKTPMCFWRIHRRNAPVTLFRRTTFRIGRSAEYAQKIGVQIWHCRKRLLPISRSSLRRHFRWRPR